MRYTAIATSGCQGGSCPTVWKSPDLEAEGDVIVQGWVVPADEARALGVPEGETLVRVPRDMLRRIPDA